MTDMELVNKSKSKIAITYNYIGNNMSSIIYYLSKVLPYSEYIKDLVLEGGDGRVHTISFEYRQILVVCIIDIFSSTLNITYKNTDITMVEALNTEVIEIFNYCCESEY